MVIPLEVEVVNELFMPPYAFGVVMFVVLIVILQIVRGIGKSRPHS